MGTERQFGKVDWYNRERGFGVIRGDDGIEYFVHNTNVKAQEFRLFGKGQEVEFLARERRNGKGLEAYDVDVVETEPRGSGLLAITEQLAFEAAANHESAKRWHLWCDVKDEYPELEDGFQHLASELALEEVPLDQATVKRIFPDDIPDGAWPKNHDKIRDSERRRGAYIAFKQGDVRIIVHAFYRSRKRDFTCWRAKAFRYLGDRVAHMPRKQLYSGGSKPHIWCENLWGCFLSDVATMIQDVRMRKSTGSAKLY